MACLAGLARRGAPGKLTVRAQALSLTGAAVALALVFVTPSSSRGEDAEMLRAEVQRNRTALDALGASAMVDGERPRLKGLLDDVDALVKNQRVSSAIEILSSVAPGVSAIARGGAGWDDTGRGAGKHIEALEKEWEEVGRALQAGRGRFPGFKPAGQTAFVRAIAEQSLGQVDEQYAVAVDYGRFSGPSAGAYYLGRAEGQMAFALFLSGVSSASAKRTPTLASLAAPIAAVENDIVTAYAKPGSTAQHSNFILANSSLKLASELDLHGWRLGSLVTLLRSLFALTLATLPVPAPDKAVTLAAKTDEFETRFTASRRDDSIGQAFVEKARIAIEKSRGGGEAGDRERLRAAALLTVVIPRYIEIMEGFDK
jgi:hypothetical protein